MDFKTEDNLERQQLLKEFDKKIRNSLIKKPKKIGIRDLLRDMGLGRFNKGGIVAKTNSKFKGHF
tara:strand:- start:1120 stop:1314 length:195 start_codon:yes stop_codon:yes gene_type:complete